VTTSKFEIQYAPVRSNADPRLVEQRDPRAEHHRALQPEPRGADHDGEDPCAPTLDAKFQRGSGRQHLAGVSPNRAAGSGSGVYRPIRQWRHDEPDTSGNREPAIAATGREREPAAGGGGYYSIAYRSRPRASTGSMPASTTEREDHDAIDTLPAGVILNAAPTPAMRCSVVSCLVSPRRSLCKAPASRAAATSFRPIRTSRAARPASRTCRNLRLRLRTPRLSPFRARRLIHAEQRHHAVPQCAQRLHRPVRAYLPDSESGVATRRTSDLAAAKDCRPRRAGATSAL